MRSNQPNTGRERPFHPSEILVSQTNLRGVISYANEAFARVSGYAVAELVGASHDIVRHPAVPADVFGDMWRNLKQGTVWRGVIKNRCKNGDHYWVDALIMPMRKNGAICGYRSVHRRAHPEDVAWTEKRFKKSRTASSVLARLPTGFGAAATTVLFAVVLLAAAISGAFGLARSEQAMDEFRRLSMDDHAWREVLLRRANEEQVLYHNLRIANEMLIALALGGIAGGLVLLRNGVLRSIRERFDDLTRIAEGDLSVRIDVGGRGEIGRLNCALAATQAQFQWLVDHIHQDGMLISSKSVRLKQIAVRLVDSIEEQHGRVFRVVDSVSDMKQTAAALIKLVEGFMSECARAAADIDRHAKLTGACGETRSRLRRLSAHLDNKVQAITADGHVLAVFAEEIERDMQHIADRLVDDRGTLHELWWASENLARAAGDLEKSAHGFEIG